MHDALAATITDAANNIIVGRDYFNLYSGTQWPSRADSFPATFDLRNRGVIAPIKNQNPWGTCWSFATMAAAESSILSSLNTTVEGYEQQYGEPLDLSEKHLAYFTLTPLPLAADYPDGNYPWDVSQQGEGNQGESFASYDGEWVDWADEVAEIAANHELCNLLAYDNLPIKGYAYPLDEVKEAHQFDTTVAVPGGEASACSDCGFVLTDVNE